MPEVMGYVPEEAREQTIAPAARETAPPETDKALEKRREIFGSAWNKLNPEQQQALADNIFTGEKEFAAVAGDLNFGNAEERAISKVMHKGLAGGEKAVRDKAEQMYEAYWKKTPENFISKLQQKIAKIEADILGLNQHLESGGHWDPKAVQRITDTIDHLTEHAAWLKELLEKKNVPESRPEDQKEKERWQRLEKIIARELKEDGPEAKNVIKTLADLGMDFVETSISKPDRSGRQENYLRTTLFANPLSEKMPQKVKDTLEQSGFDQGLKNFGERLLKFLVQEKVPQSTVDALLKMVGFSKNNFVGKLSYPNEEEAKAILEFLNNSEDIPFAMYIKPDIRNLSNMAFIHGQSGEVRLRHHRAETAPSYGEDDNTEFFASPVLSFEEKLNQ